MISVVERLTIQQVCEIVVATSRTRDVEIEGDTVTFKFLDRDKDDLIINVYQPFTDQRIAAITGFSIDDNRQIAALEGSNAWNGDAARGTTSTVIAADESEMLVCLQSQLSLVGGVAEANIQAWLLNFVDCINDWQEVLADAFDEVPSDGDLMSENSSYLDAIGRGLSAIAPALAVVAEGVTHGLLGWLSSDDEDDYEPPPRKRRRKSR